MRSDAYFPSTSAGRATAGSAPNVNRTRARVVAASCVGNLLEWYDFAIYAFFAPNIAAQLFPAEDSRFALLAAYLVFGVSFIARPVGGLLIGRFGDRRGRKPALVLTIFAMASGTALIGLIPPYAAIGVAAPTLLIVARLLQGVSAGGEWGGSVVFLIEWAPPGRRGLFGGIHETSAVLGPLLASTIAATVASLLSSTAADGWGWRVPFLLGGLLGPVGFMLRRTIEETPAFRKTAVQPEEHLLDTRTIAILGIKTFTVVAIAYASFYTLFYMGTFLVRYADIPHAEALWSSTIATLVLAIIVPVTAALSDRIGRKPLMLAGCLLLAVTSYPLFALLTKGASFELILTVQILFAIMMGLYAGPFPTAVAEQFPTQLRLTVPSVSYSLAGIVFGGFNSYITTWLIETTGTPSAVSCLVVIAATLSGLGLLTLRETAHDRLS